MHKAERLGLEKVRMYLDLARSYDNSEDRERAILRAVECLDVVLRMDNRFRKRLSDALKVTFGA